MTAEGDVHRVLPDLVLDIDGPEDDPDNVLFTNQEEACSSKSNKSLPDSQNVSASQTVQKLNGKLQNSEEQKSVKMEARPTPRRTQVNNSRGTSKAKQSEHQEGIRPCEQHTFLTDITEVRQMEQGLLKLLDDFHSGKLQAFGKDRTFEKMEQVREQQERLARLHFELNAQQEMYGPQSEDRRQVGRENLGKLIENLQHLSRSICSVNNSKFQAPVYRLMCDVCCTFYL